MPRSELVDEFHGHGLVRYKGGEPIGKYEYDLYWYEEVFDDGTPGGMRDIGGSIPGLDEVGLAQCQAELTLELEGGKKLLHFMIRAGGGIAPIGDGFYDVTE